MKRVFSLAVIVFSLLAGSMVQPALAAGWELLGEKKVSRRAETDVIKVGARKGAFKRIQLRVKGADVNFHKVLIRYENGKTREIKMRDTVKKDGSSRAIDLPGAARAIDQVSFWYDTEGSGRLQATVLLWGNSV